MALSTRLKYNRFQGDESEDMDNYTCEFESIVTANHEDREAKRRIFKGLLKGEALKWDIPYKIKDN